MNVIERFLKYVAFDTQSDEHTGTTPSTEKQKRLGEALAEEMREIGLEGVRMDDCCNVYGYIPATKGCESIPTLGFLAHLDTSPDVSGKDVKARIVKYTGGDLPLGNGAILSPSMFPSLNRYVGQELIVTDGSTLLGADDKAGIAEIMAACDELIRHPEWKHGRIAIAFTPDEEIGCGTDHFPAELFGASAAYTVDGGELGEIEYENFNAASAKLTVHGLNIHPGSAKNKMKNAILLANEWISRLPAAEIPAHTEGYEGFFHVHDIEGNESQTTLALLVRDHDREKFEARKQFLRDLTAFENGIWGKDTFELTVQDSYYNMKEMILPHPELIDRAKEAMLSAGAEPLCIPIRGGTDGAKLSYMGIPTPNLSTGGTNAHGIHEYIPVPSLEKMVQVILYLMKNG